jgi:hypothetical protein
MRVNIWRNVIGSVSCTPAGRVIVRQSFRGPRVVDIGLAIAEHDDATVT